MALTTVYGSIGIHLLSRVPDITLIYKQRIHPSLVQDNIERRISLRERERERERERDTERAKEREIRKERKRERETDSDR
eukprot:SAG31_NODE_7054_length_1800_cov_1.843805_1_plen_79_part_10